MKKIIFPAITMCLFACNSNNSQKTISITNNSSSVIDSIRIGGPVSFAFPKIAPGKESQKKFSILKEELYEGVFTVTVYLHDSTLPTSQFGYYVNTNSIKDHIRVSFTDSLKIVEIQK